MMAFAFRSRLIIMLANCALSQSPNGSNPPMVTLIFFPCESPPTFCIRFSLKFLTSKNKMTGLSHHLTTELILSCKEAQNRSSIQSNVTGYFYFVCVCVCPSLFRVWGDVDRKERKSPICLSLSVLC